MFVIEKLKLNKLERKPIVRNRHLFRSVGEKPATIQSKETSDCYSTQSIEGASKTKILGLAHEVLIADFEHHKGENVDTINKGQRNL